MTSSMLKHQARLQNWALEIQDCRSSGLSVAKWCEQRGITKTTYYRWEREVLACPGNSREVPTQEQVAFVELPAPAPVCCETVTERSATLRIGNGSLDIYQKLSPNLLRTMIEALRSC